MEAAAIIALFVGTLSYGAQIEHPSTNPLSATVAIGATTNYAAGETYGELALSYRNWTLSAGEQGNRRNNFAQGTTEVYSLTRKVNPDQWKGAYLNVGPAYVHNSPFVGNTNFRLGAGYEWRNMSIEYSHISSGGVHRPNTGWDAFTISMKFN